VLYLAEVQKKGGGLLGGSRVELKLLACQRAEQSWSAVSGDEAVVADEASTYSPGSLVLVEISANKQVQRVQEAGRPLVSILQNFSRLQEKFKTQEEEIEQWKQSLTYQSQELNRREMEMETRREQLQQMEEDLEQLEQQRRELEATREEVTRLQEEFTRKSQDLEGAWDHLRGEMQRLEERKAQLEQAAGLDAEQVRSVQDLLDRVSTAVPTVDSVQERLTLTLDILNQKQSLLDQHWQALEQQRQMAQQGQEEIDQQGADLHRRWQEWHQAQESLEQARAELKIQQNAIQIKQDYARLLGVQLQNQDDLHQQLYRLVDSSENITIGHRIDVKALENLSVDELQRLTQDLERELEKLHQFVDSQEEELRSKQQEIEALQQKIEQASEYDRLNLENDLADEQDGYQMLNETLVGQRRNLRERESILKQHQAVLRRRQGQADLEKGDEIDLGPVLNQIEAQRQQQADELHHLESQIEQMQATVQQTQDVISGRVSEQEQQRNELKQLEQALQERRSQVAELWGKVNLYQEWLQPVQNRTHELRQSLEDMLPTLAQVRETSDHQLQLITELRQMVTSLSDVPQLAAS
jgi:chromosome segregation ATPase